MRALMRKYEWLCPALSVVLAVVILVTVGMRWSTALLLGLVLGCPIAFVWALIAGRLSAADHKTPAPRRPRPHPRG
jgi:hypothetical protein